MFKKELILEGLDCANCSAKIESEVNQITNVNASMNFITKTLTIETESKQELDDALAQVKSIVNKHEPKVVVKEKIKGTVKSYILAGLSCASCAAKIEGQIKNLPGVNSATVDFVSKKLIIEAESKQLDTIIGQATAIVKSIEPDVNLVSEENKGKTKNNNTEKASKKKIMQIAVSGALFVLGLALNLPHRAEPAVFLLSYLIVGGEIIFRALKNIPRGNFFDENSLMTIATIGAFLIGEYPEGVAVMLFYQVGEFFQDLAVNRSRRSIGALMNIRPDFANLKVGDSLKKVSPEEVKIGDIILVKPGEKVPLDGKVIAGTSMVDTSALTGESMPREVAAGDEILSGFINKNGLLTVEVTAEFSASTVSKILDLVQNAAARKAPTENFITKFAGYYTPAVVLTALFIALIPPLVLSDAVFSDWLYRALVFLVISCPCALVVSIPLSFFGGIGAASKKGILVKGSNYLEALNQVETVIFDKTGTLTKGVFNVTEINPHNNYSKEDLLKYAAYAESYSNHPIAVSILKAYQKEVDKAKIESYQEISGYGVKVKVQGINVLTGNAKLMKKENINYPEVDSAGTVVHVAVEHTYAGYIVIADEVKADSSNAVKALKALGVKKAVMLTGDALSVAKRVGNALKLDEVYAELLPNEKVEKLEMLDRQKAANKKLVFVGDGINDAPVLARADIGIAMGGLGSDAAIEAADIVIMTDEPSKIATAIKIAQRTRKIVWQNIVFALGVKLIFLTMGGLGIASMWQAVFADVGVTLIAIINAMRVLSGKNI